MPIIHPFGPLYDSNSKILILGSFPSVKSREANFFYGHPQNRFWKVMASVLNCNTPITTDEKSAMLLGNGIALWDSLASCDIVGSSDSSITNPVANDLSPIFNAANIRLLCFNGKKSEEIYRNTQRLSIRSAPAVFHQPALQMPDLVLTSSQRYGRRLFCPF